MGHLCSHQRVMLWYESSRPSLLWHKTPLQASQARYIYQYLPNEYNTDRVLAPIAYISFSHLKSRANTIFH